MNFHVSIVSGLFALLMGLSVFTQAETITINTYHLDPPFILGNGQGLTYDLAAYLTDKADGEYGFNVREIPRKRLNMMLANGDTGVVPWVLPEWFKDKNETKHLWTKSFFPDGNAIVSSTSSPIEFKGDINVFYGKTLGALSGNRIVGIEEAIRNGEIRRHDVNTIEANLKKLMSGRVEFSIGADSAIRYLVKNMKINDRIHFSEQPYAKYSRRFLVPKSSEALFDFLQTTVSNMESDPEWQHIVNKYR